MWTKKHVLRKTHNLTFASAIKLYWAFKIWCCYQVFFHQKHTDLVNSNWNCKQRTDTYHYSCKIRVIITHWCCQAFLALQLSLNFLFLWEHNIKYLHNPPCLKMQNTNKFSSQLTQLMKETSYFLSLQFKTFKKGNPKIA